MGGAALDPEDTRDPLRAFKLHSTSGRPGRGRIHGVGWVNVQVLAEQAVAAGWNGGRLPRAVDREIKVAASSCQFPEWVYQNIAGCQRSFRLRLVLWVVVAVTVVTAVTLMIAHLVDPADRWIPLTVLPTGPVLALHLIGANWNADMRPRILSFQQKGMVVAFRFLVSGAAAELIHQ